MKIPVFVLYPETYVLLQEAHRDKRFDDDAHRRTVAFVSAWEAALQEFGDRVTQVAVYCKNGILMFDAHEGNAWRGEAEQED